MTKYAVTINLNSLSYEFEAENEDEAIAIAEGFALDETQYDLLKWAGYDVEVLV
jgi:hypothetical protein